MKLQSIELDTPDAAGAAAFLSGAWGAIDAGEARGAHYVRGAGPLPYLVALHQAAAPAVRSITFAAEPGEIARIAVNARAAGLTADPVRSTDLGGGDGVEVRLGDGEVFRFLAGVAAAEPIAAPDAPVRLTHIVLNAVDAERSAVACETVFGFSVSDRTRAMVFVRCNQSHHSVAFARAGYTSLNHIAFEMTDLDAVMRGIGRMRDIGLDLAWGPGRHGPGANVFAYYIAPFGAVVEFSTAVQSVGEDHVAGTPDFWTWPANRIDRWGLSDKDVPALQRAEQLFRFAAAADARQVLAS